MNGDSDESEYISDEGSQSSDQKTAVKQANGPMVHDVVKTEEPHDSSAVSELPLGNTSGSRRRDTKAPIHVLRAYRDLLNTAISEIFTPAKDTDVNALAASQIGASIWTSEEKDKFFASLPSCGPGNLSALSAAIGTKSQPEIKAYTQLLQEGVRELDVTAKPTSKFGLADVPAAPEISVECLEWEETLAEALESKTRKKEEVQEAERWGEDDWLIDEDVAEAIEEEFDEVGRTEHKHETHEKPMPDPNDVQENDNDGTAEGDGSDAQIDGDALSSDLLFKPSTFLELSRVLFMNSSDPDLNWNHLTESEEARPSIRRTAFQDFYNLTVSLTRRLVQASIFQGLSRLRASSDSRLLPAVNGNDVRAACDIVGSTRRPSYWADAVRRCGLEVYSDAKKFRGQDGRRGTKNGYKLTRAELEAELGVSSSRPDIQSDEDDSIADDTSDDEPDSDAYTDTSSSEIDVDEESDADSKEAVNQRSRTKHQPSERKQALSPMSFDRAEKKYLESLDHINSTVEENKLRGMLHMEPLPKPSLSMPAFPCKRLHNETRPLDWRETTQFEAPWEQLHGMPQLHEFQKMDLEGARRRKRRRGNAGEPATMSSDNQEKDRDRASRSDSDDGINENDDDDDESGQGSSSKQGDQ